MFKTIVLATDLSPAWDEIVACAGEFKALGCSEIILTYVSRLAPCPVLLIPPARR